MNTPGRHLAQNISDMPVACWQRTTLTLTILKTRCAFSVPTKIQVFAFHLHCSATPYTAIKVAAPNLSCFTFQFPNPSASVCHLQHMHLFCSAVWLSILSFHAEQQFMAAIVRRSNASYWLIGAASTLNNKGCKCSRDSLDSHLIQDVIFHTGSLKHNVFIYLFGQCLIWVVCDTFAQSILDIWYS